MEFNEDSDEYYSYSDVFWHSAALIGFAVLATVLFIGLAYRPSPPPRKPLRIDIPAPDARKEEPIHEQL